MAGDQTSTDECTRVRTRETEPPGALDAEVRNDRGQVCRADAAPGRRVTSAFSVPIVARSSRTRQGSRPGLPESLREKYFARSGSSYGFHRDLRRGFIFGRHHLVRDAAILRVDLLSCRNVHVLNRKRKRASGTTKKWFAPEHEKRSAGLSASIQHALNDPLMVVLGNLDFVLESDALTAELRGALVQPREARIECAPRLARTRPSSPPHRRQRCGPDQVSPMEFRRRLGRRRDDVVPLRS